MTTISVLKDPAESWKGDAILILAGEGKFAKIVPEPYARYVKILEQRKDFEGKKGSLTKVPLFGDNVKNLYLAGLGKPKEHTPDLLRGALASALRKIGRERNESVLILTDKTGPETDVILGEAAELAGYVFDKYKKKDDEDGKNGGAKFSLGEIFVPQFDKKKVALGKIFGGSQRFARDLANEPGNVINPVSLAEIAERFAGEHGLSCEIWDEKRLAEEKMGALLAVGRGSATPPRLIHLTYVPKGKAKKKIVFVGKGLTFDSGGLNLKPSDFIKTMKGDKSGACNVLGIMKGAAELGPKAEVHGIIAAAENMPGGSSYRPDDIIRARNGKTIEIDNTDAEGRLVLADALALAGELKPDAIIDMATLTGACAVALGNWTAGLFTADESLSKALLESAGKRGERLWPLPIDDEKIGETVKSKFADLINGGSRYGGATFAAMFLAEFVEKDISWAHLDIAGTDFMKDESGIYSKGATAWGVRTCLDYLAGV